MSQIELSRRTLMQFTAAAGLGLVTQSGRASASPWLPYDPSDVKVLMPRANDPRAQTVRQFLPSTAPTRMKSASRPKTGIGMKQPPTAYVLTSQRSGVPAWLLFGVALQESKIAFGGATLPYPWTLCVRGRGERHRTYDETLAALKRYVSLGITNVDCGAMQVNWHWHQDKLRSFELALDPYPNLAVGAQILRTHFAASGDWRSAIGLYHAGSMNSSSKRQAAASYADSVLNRLQRNGVDLRAVLGRTRDV